MKITVDLKGLDQVRKNLQGFSERRGNAAIATALTRTAVKIKQAVTQELPKVIDRPTRYTLNAFYVDTATANRLSASVYLKGIFKSSPRNHYLVPLIDGGDRNIKRFEKALQAKGAMPVGWHTVPGAGARIDANGNVSRGQIAQIISQLGTELLSGYTNTPQSLKAKMAAQRKAGGQFIAAMPGNRLKLKPGIYQRERIGRNLSPVLIFVKSTAYKQRIDFDGIAKRTIDQHLKPEMDRAVAEQVARLAQKGAA